MKKITVTVGIPAFNEEKNIIKEIKALLSQSQTFWSLDSIIVVSDASTDNTIKYVKELKNKKIKIFSNKTRKGKPFALNLICQEATSDVVVLLDADLNITQLDSISNLIKPFTESTTTQLTSGNEIPVRVEKLAEKISYRGSMIWEYAKAHTKNSEMYFCGGPIRAIGKKLYKKIKFPDTSADDVIAYFQCKKLNYNFVYVDNVNIGYFLPNKLHDYYIQYRRFLKSPNIQSNIFGSDVIQSSFVIGELEKLKSAMHNLLVDPIWTIAFILFVTYIKIHDTFYPYKDTSRWDMATTTKTIL